jgi:predicted nucleotidyltransferase
MTDASHGSLAARLGLDAASLAAFCDRWKIQELSLFGSGLRGELRPESDLDFLVTFRPNAQWSLVDHVRMQEELAGIVHRDVDLVSRRGIERSTNWIRRHAILEEARPIYAAG